MEKRIDNLISIVAIAICIYILSFPALYIFEAYKAKYKAQETNTRELMDGCITCQKDGVDASCLEEGAIITSTSADCGQKNN